MEVRTKDVCIKVDNARFVTTPGARMTLDGVAAYIDVAIQYGCVAELNQAMLTLLHGVVSKYNSKHTPREDDDYDDKPEGW